MRLGTGETDVSYGDMAHWKKNDEWMHFLDKIDILIHTAARVHLESDPVPNPLEEARKINLKATQVLLESALERGVKKIIFLSTIHVNGESTENRGAFREEDTPEPKSPYAISKWEAEECLKEMAQKYHGHISVIRPPLVYGEGLCAKGNVLKLINLVKKCPILPFGGVHNKRAMVSLNNLASLIHRAIENNHKKFDLFLANDSRDRSTGDFIRVLAQLHGRPVFLLPIPSFILKMVFSLLGLKHLSFKLFNSLRVDTSYARSQLGWEPSDD